MDLSGRRIAITGASSGIGEAIALAAADAGAAVALGARREDRIAELARRIEDDGGRAVALTTEVSAERQAGAVTTELVEQNRPEIAAAIEQTLGEGERLEPDDIARAVVYVMAQPEHVAINEVLVRPTDQAR